MHRQHHLPLIILTLFSGLFAFTQNNSITVETASPGDTINRNIYGHFAEHLGRGIYEGIYVGSDSEIPNTDGIRLDVLTALKELNIPVLRWPGGCFAEQYHWKDGIGPAEERPATLNAFWGGVTEDNSFGTHEFLKLCELLETEPYIAVNIASGTVKDAYQWIEYVTSDADSDMTRLRKKNGRDKPWKVKYWGIGNENWGCGGSMDAGYYLDVFKRYSTYCNADYKIASGGVFDDLEWTRTFMEGIREVPDFIDIAHGLSYHYYTIANSWENKGSAIDFEESEWFRSMQHTLEMEANLEQHIAIMDELDPDNSIALIADEWGTWYEVTPGTEPGFLHQQNTLRDALVAALGLNIFNNHPERIKMANIAQMVNVLQAMVLTKGADIVKTPTYYVFKMFRVHQDAIALPTRVNSQPYVQGGQELPSLSVSCSRDSEGLIHLTVANIHPTQNLQTQITINGLKRVESATGQYISGASMNSYNDFNADEQVTIRNFTEFSTAGNSIQLDIPARSVLRFDIRPAN